MGRTYSNVSGLKRSVFPLHSDGKVLEESGGDIIEFYFDKSSGNLTLHFISDKKRETWINNLRNGGHIRIDRSVRMEEGNGHMIDIPIKPNRDWNSFVEDLPKWGDVE